MEYLKDKSNPIIISHYDKTYMDTGFGNEEGVHYKTYIKWRSIYKMNPYLEGKTVLGGESCMWS